MRYFKKTQPKRQVLIDKEKNLWLVFTQVEQDLGIYATNDNNILNGIDRAIAEQRGGMEEINAEEYKALGLKKNSTPLRPMWREEISKGPNSLLNTPAPIPMEQAGPDVGVAVVDLGKPKPPDMGSRPTATKK